MHQATETHAMLDAHPPHHGVHAWRNFFIPAVTVAGLCVAALAWYVVTTWRWPFMGDATYLHYAVFLVQHGKVPYRDIHEINTPLSYLIEGAVMRTLGDGALGWRLFDYALMAATVACCMRLLRHVHWIAGLLAATLFTLAHTQDGVMMAGERDLISATFQLISLTVLFATDAIVSQPSRARLPFPDYALLATASCFASAAFCIKPSTFLFPLVLFWWMYRHILPASKATPWKSWTAAALGFALPLTASAAYIFNLGALAAFFHATHSILWLHARIERRSLLYLLSHCWSPFAAWFGAVLISRWLTAARTKHPRLDQALLAASLAGLASYLFQGKGFSYQRYPFLIFSLPLATTILWQAWTTSPGRSLTRRVSALALLYGLVILVVAAKHENTYSQTNPYARLQTDLTRFNAQQASGSIQCMDTAGECIGALYNERLAQSTGFVYDCYFQHNDNPVTTELRSQFQQQLTINPPRLLVLTDSNCFSGPRTFAKFDDWPWFVNLLKSSYTLQLDRGPGTPTRYWNRTSTTFSYRIYEHR